MTWERQRAYDLEAGIAIGEKRGAHDNAVKNAINFLKMNVNSIEQIAQSTGLTVEEVQKLADEIQTQKKE